MQLSIVLSRIEAEETNGSEGKLQTEGGGGGEMKCEKLERLRYSRKIGGEKEGERGEIKSKLQKGIRGRGRRGGIET